VAQGRPETIALAFAIFRFGLTSAGVRGRRRHRSMLCLLHRLNSGCEAVCEMAGSTTVGPLQSLDPGVKRRVATFEATFPILVLVGPGVP
jgi:hypothetical protein